MRSLKHALGALYGLAIGDALGMPTQSLPRTTIVARYGHLITQFYPGSPDHPIVPGLPGGTVTDDTEQALLLANLLVQSHGSPDVKVLAEKLIEWENDMQRRGSHDLLGPSTKSALASLQSGQDAKVAGRFGTTNGAAMRIAPVGIASPIGDLTRLVDNVERVSHLTHNTGLALAGAAAIAAAVSAGIEAYNTEDATKAAIQAAEIAGQRGYWVAGADIATRIRWAMDVMLSPSKSGQDPATIIDHLIGTSLMAQESIPAAFAVLTVHPREPWKACQLAASLGGDTDTIASMAGAMGGALCGVDAFPEWARNQVTLVNQLSLEPLAQSLLDLRKKTAP